MSIQRIFSYLDARSLRAMFENMVLLLHAQLQMQETLCIRPPPPASRTPYTLMHPHQSS